MTDLNVHTDTAAMARRRITFMSEGIELVGDLRLPGVGPGAVGVAEAEAGIGDGWPAVVLTGPFTGVKEQVTGSYAELLAAAGFVTLAFDHRGFGESGGRRQHEDSQGKLADLRAAVSALAARAEVDPARIGLAGICLGGGYAIRAAAQDPRVRAVAGNRGRLQQPGRDGRVDGHRGATGLPSALSWTATTRTCLRWRPTAGRPRWAATSRTPTTARPGLARRTGATRSPGDRCTR